MHNRPPSQQAPNIVRHIERIHAHPIADLHIHHAKLAQWIAPNRTDPSVLRQLPHQNALRQAAHDPIGIATSDQQQRDQQHTGCSDSDVD